MMKLFVYGAGVIGNYLTHALCTAGYDVSTLVHGRRKGGLEKNGLVTHCYIQRKTIHGHPRVIEGLGSSEHYDVVFAIMQYQQTRGILDDLARANSLMVVLVDNNPSATKIEECIKTYTAMPKTIVLGF